VLGVTCDPQGAFISLYSRKSIPYSLSEAEANGGVQGGFPMADFIFRVASTKLTPAQQAKIATAIQGAVLTELAKLDLGTASPQPECLYRPIHWAGGIMIPPEELPSVLNSTLTAVSSTAQTRT
jgi:hypothetical protein